MTDTTPAPLSSAQEDLIAFRLAKQALRYMAMLLAPLLLVAGWLGWDSYKGLRDNYDESTARLVAATKVTEARADTLKALLDTLHDALRVQSATLQQNSDEAKTSRTRLDTYYADLTRESADMRSQVGAAVSGVNQTSAFVRHSFESLSADNHTRFERLATTANAANQRADSAVRIAEEARVQTVGARERQQLYGTPFVVSFSGVKRSSLRDFTIADEHGIVVWNVPSQPSHQAIPLPNAANPTHYIEIINVLDIPGGMLMRLNGSSRADAATFRVTRVTGPRAETATAAP